MCMCVGSSKAQHSPTSYQHSSRFMVKRNFQRHVCFCCGAHQKHVFSVQMPLFEGNLWFGCVLNMCHNIHPSTTTFLKICRKRKFLLSPKQNCSTLFGTPWNSFIDRVSRVFKRPHFDEAAGGAHGFQPPLQLGRPLVTWDSDSAWDIACAWCDNRCPPLPAFPR